MDKNILANFFDWNREVVEAAESPFARLAAFILPILAPSVPAFITGVRLYSLYLQLIGDKLPPEVALAGAVVTATVLEILGYVGIVAGVRFIYKWAKTRRDEYLVPMVLTGLSAVFYLVVMGLINIQLGHVEPNADLILAFLAALSIPAGLIFASNLVENEEKKSEYEIRQEKRDDKLKAKLIKAGIDPRTPIQTYQSSVPLEIIDTPKGDWRLLSDREKSLIRSTLSVQEIMGKHNVSRSTAFDWKKK